VGGGGGEKRTYDDGVSGVGGASKKSRRSGSSVDESVGVGGGWKLEAEMKSVVLPSWGDVELTEGAIA